MKKCVKVLCPEISEALQKIAFAAGYKWRTNDQEFLNHSGAYLVFDSVIKTLTHCDTVCFELLTIGETINFFKSKPTFQVHGEPRVLQHLIELSGLRNDLGDEQPTSVEFDFEKDWVNWTEGHFEFDAETKTVEEALFILLGE
jgi:hypothetical protein